MRNSKEALKIALADVRTAVRQDNYLSAARACTDFIKLSYHLDCKPELFLGEVLEGVYGQIGRELDFYIVPEKDKKELKDTMTKHMDNLLAAYDAQKDLCGILTDIRHAATVFQFESTLKYKMSQRVRHGRR